ncbi:MAG: type II CAAX endopeptidase family protein, partial [Lacisediminihabitans sp.]
MTSLPGERLPDESIPYESSNYEPNTRIRWGLPDAGVLLTLNLVAIYGLEFLVATFPSWRDSIGFFGSLFFYAVTFALLFFVSRSRGLGSLARDFGLQFKRIDVAIGLAIGLGLTLLLAVIANVMRNAHALPPVVPTDRNLIWVIFSQGLLAVIVVPVAEELTNRGLVMRAVRNHIVRRHATVHGQGAALYVSIVASALVFAALHLHEAQDLPSGIALGMRTFIFGILAGWIATKTGRLGPSIIAHGTLNAISFFAALAA